MKFAKELNDELVPEWRAKYMNYKLGKKKIKAIQKALQKANRTPIRRQETFQYTPSQQLPPNTSTSAAQLPLDYNGSPSRKDAVRVSEQRPLRTPGSRFSNTVGSYGSITTEPGHKDSTHLPNLELPSPAISPLVQYDSSGKKNKEQQVSPALNGSASPMLQRPPGRPQRIASSPVLTKGGQPASGRIDAAGDGYLKTTNFLKRVFTNSEMDSPGKSFQATISSEVAKKEDEFFDFLDSELDKIEAFYKQKELEASERLQALRQQLHMMKDQRTAEMRNAERMGSTDTKGNQHGNYLSVIPRTKWTQAIVGKHHFGKNSRALANMQTPQAPAAMDGELVANRRDFVRRPESIHVPYRTAKRKLKLALQEYYRGLELLKAYAYLNRKAFRKINKKFDKTVDVRPTLRYMSEKVNKAYFVQSEVLEGHMMVVEDLYSRYFERGNRKIAVTKLRGKQRSDDYSPSTFRTGLLLAAGIVSCIQGLKLAVGLLEDADSVVKVQASYLLQIYAGYFLVVFHCILFCLDCMIWTRAKINYAFVFEYDTRHTLDWRQLTEIPSVFFMLLGLFMWINFSYVDSMFLYYPVLLMFISVVILFLPLKWRLLLAGLYPVEFRDFFLGDMYCSQTYSMGNIELFFCLYANYWNNPTTCNSGNSRLLGFFTTLPSIWRGLQCLRRYRDTQNAFPHLVNFGKYTCGILYYMTLSFYRIDRHTHYQVVFIIFAFINAVYCSIWDVAMDWSLGNFYAPHKFLRDVLAFRNAWYYYVAIVIDVVIRFNWIFYAIFTHDIQHSAFLSFAVSLTEIFRRGVWTIFRVENEHCTNVNLFRALRDIPLPYQLEESTLVEDIGDHPSPEQRPERDVEREREGIYRGDGPNDPTPFRPSSAGIDVDIESAMLAGKTPTLRARRPGVSETISRFGTLVATAHSHDFQRRRRVDPLSGEATSSALQYMDDDDSTDEEDENDAKPSSRNTEMFSDSQLPDHNSNLDNSHNRDK
ncbi:hypothetical protein UA08_03857 [Talaromyces atroroseus]|uniref:Protein SYG1-like protein n=1 Tax=Talaromyces atroroseus TaxID=1441469 RepID=A0A225AK43_TALAT|nr:hypothetical protein UA08_03857 [Talaromyces atroroseus]OKL61240.1 hypothetical protein UA08_03857 [Talaromyces atroroseus]